MEFFKFDLAFKAKFRKFFRWFQDFRKAQRASGSPVLSPGMVFRVPGMVFRVCGTVFRVCEMVFQENGSFFRLPVLYFERPK